MKRPSPLASPPARAYGFRASRALLSNRKGHGGGPCSARRLGAAELAALCAVAFDAGREHAHAHERGHIAAKA